MNIPYWHWRITSLSIDIWKWFHLELWSQSFVWFLDRGWRLWNHNHISLIPSSQYHYILGYFCVTFVFFFLCCQCWYQYCNNIYYLWDMIGFVLLGCLVVFREMYSTSDRYLTNNRWQVVKKSKFCIALRQKKSTIKGTCHTRNLWAACKPGKPTAETLLWYWHEH